MPDKYIIEIYQIKLVTSSFIKVEEFSSSYENLRFSYGDNDSGRCSFSLNIDNPKAVSGVLQRFKNIVAIKKNDLIVWLGMITHVGGSYSGIDGSLTIEAKEYFEYLKYRYTPLFLSYAEVDAGLIAWNLIDYTQNLTNGDLLITQGNIEATVDRERNFVYANIGDEINNLTNVNNGFDFRLLINQDSEFMLSGVTFNVYENFGEQKTGLSFVQLGTSALAVELATNGNIVNDVIAISGTEGEDQIISTNSNGSSQVAYTRLESIEKFYGITEQSTLDDKAQKIISEQSFERYVLGVALKPSVFKVGDFQIGDSLYLDINRGYIDVEGWYRVEEIEVSVDNTGQEFIAVKFLINL